MTDISYDDVLDEYIAVLTGTTSGGYISQFSIGEFVSDECVICNGICTTSITFTLDDPDSIEVLEMENGLVIGTSELDATAITYALVLPSGAIPSCSNGYISITN